MVNLLKRVRLGVSPTAELPASLDAVEEARGRLRTGPTIGVIDIGSNSVRLVVYEGLTRSPTPIFNEKVLCGLGRSVATTGRLTQRAVTKALAALKRFRALCDVMRVDEVKVLATAAARDAANGQAFLDEARDICRADIELLSGKREAHLSALGIVSGIFHANGIVGDLGGGSLELIDVKDHVVGQGITLPLGGLSLQDVSEGSIKKASKIVRDAMRKASLLKGQEGRSFYAVGGTWRSLARLHMAQKHYPLRVMHAYTIPTTEALNLCRRVRTQAPESIPFINVVPSERRPLLAYGAVVLEYVLRVMKPKDVVISAMGVREGLLYEMLDSETREIDPLIAAAEEFNVLRSRSPKHGFELIDWTERLFETALLEEEPSDRRLRHAACHLADIGWRAHPDYRGQQSLNIIANAAFVGVDHPGRAFLALAIYYRNEGLSDDGVSPMLLQLAMPRLLDRAKIVGAAMRVAYLVSASMPGILPQAPIEVSGDKLVLRLSHELRDLAGERLYNRLRQLGRLVGKEAEIIVS